MVKSSLLAEAPTQTKPLSEHTYGRVCPAACRTFMQNPRINNVKKEREQKLILRSIQHDNIDAREEGLFDFAVRFHHDFHQNMYGARTEKKGCKNLIRTSAAVRDMYATMADTRIKLCSALPDAAVPSGTLIFCPCSGRSFR